MVASQVQAWEISWNALAEAKFWVRIAYFFELPIFFSDATRKWRVNYPINMPSFGHDLFAADTLTTQGRSWEYFLSRSLNQRQRLIRNTNVLPLFYQPSSNIWKIMSLAATMDNNIAGNYMQLMQKQAYTPLIYLIHRWAIFLHRCGFNSCNYHVAPKQYIEN